MVYFLCRIRSSSWQLDLWELPQSRHADTITVNVERNFYSRCSPDKRPAFLRTLHSDTPLNDSNIDKTESINVVSEEEKPGNVEPSKPKKTTGTEKSREKHDESLFKALHHTFFKRIWFSAILLVVSGK